MSRASVLFYGRRARSSRSFDDLGFGDSSSPPSSFSSDRGSSEHHRHRKNDLHRRCRHSHNLDDADKPRRPSRSRLPLPLPASEPHQQGFIGDCPSQDITNRETAHNLSGRFSGNDRLPVPVLLAKERLIQRLRGVSVSGSSSNGETEASSTGNDIWEVDEWWETNNSGQQPPVYNFSELTLGVHQQSASWKPNKKLPGLTEEILSQLHHEIYLEDHQKDIGNSTTSGAPYECSICLESFIQGNELISLCCGHRFHALCLYPWLRICGECPNCRSCIVAASYLK